MVPSVEPRRLQAAARLCFRRRHPEIAGRQDPASPAGGRGVSDGVTSMTDPVIPDPLDGFHVEIDTWRERADVILDRPPLNVITMPQREQLRTAFEAFDADEHVRIVVVRAL